MSTNRCPRCGSSDIRVNVENYVGQGVKQVGRAAVAGAAAILGMGASVISHAHGHYAAHKLAEKAWDELEPDPITKKNVCRKCGHRF